jgi:hypothetical protein
MGKRVAILIGPGQSNESSSIVRFNSLVQRRNAALRGWPNADPEGLTAGGSIWVPITEHLAAHGIDAALFNFAVGSTGILFNWSGYLTTYASSATFTAGRLVKVGSNIHKANGAAGSQFTTAASPPTWATTLSAVTNEGSGGGSWTCVAVGSADATGKLYAPGDALYDPLGLVALVRNKAISLAPRFDEVWVFIQIGQSDIGLPQALFEQAHINAITYLLAAAPNVKAFVGVTPRRWDGGLETHWDTFYQPAISNVIAAFANEPRVMRGGNCASTTDAMMLPESGGTLKIHVNNLGADHCAEKWRAALDVSGAY